jgi:hypothetical protein
MRARFRFRPVADELESKVVLSHLPPTFSVLTSGFRPNVLAVRKNRPVAPIALVNTAFSQFQQDFTQASSLYDNQVLMNQAKVVDQSSFINYIVQRVDLLAQQLTNILESTPLATSGSRPAVSVITRKINGRGTASGSSASDPMNFFAGGTLGKALVDSTPLVQTTGASPTPVVQTPTSIALDTQSQVQAIQAAQVAMVNAVNVIKTDAFNSHPSHVKKF